MKFEEFVENSVTGSWGGLIFGLLFLTGVLASVLNTSINPFIALIGVILLVSLPLAWKAYKDTLDK